MNFKQILLLLKLRWWLMLTLFLVIVAATAAVSVVMPRQYSAMTTLLLDQKSDPFLHGVAPNLGNPGYMANQANTIASPPVASRVVKMLGLADSASAVEQWREATQGRIGLETFYGELLLKSLKVETVPQSSMLEVTFTGKDPKFAAAVANAFAKSYLDLLDEFQQGPAREVIATLEKRLRSLRTELQASQDSLTAFEQKKGIVISDERMDVEQQRLGSLELALATALAEEAVAVSKAPRGGSLEIMVDVQQNAVVQNLKQQLTTAVTRAQEIGLTYGSRHPQVIQAEAQVATIRAQLNAEQSRVANTTVESVAVSKRRTAELRAQVEQQKRAVLGLRSERAEATGMRREVDAAQKAYEAVAKRLSELYNEVQAKQASARVLTPAVEPLEHSKPNIPKNIALAIVMGILSGLAAAIGWEFLDRRVRSEDDMLVADGVPVLGVLSSKPLDARARILPAPVRHRLGGAMPPQLTLDGSPS